MHARSTDNRPNIEEHICLMFDKYVTENDQKTAPGHVKDDGKLSPS